MKGRTVLGAIGLIAALILGACGGGNTSDTSNALESATAATTDQSSSASSGPGSGTGDGTGSDATTTAGQQTATTELLISIANHPSEPKYQQGVMQVPAGTEFVVNYNNPSQEEHNWVVVEPGKEQAVADAAAAKGGDPTGVAGVIAWSKPIAGSSTEIRVPPLQQGGYPYICTLPGHLAAGHQGALDVK
ncbi:MAG TPA: plastocyanin/azurin family copper-binding protein [Herpetosiphonaceae bacterium]